MACHPCATNVGAGGITCSCPSAQNYTKQGQVRDNLNYQWGSRTKPSPREQPHAQSTRAAGEPVRLNRDPEYHNPDPVAWLIGPPSEVQVEVNGVITYPLIDMGVQITTIAYSFARQLQLEVHNLN